MSDSNESVASVIASYFILTLSLSIYYLVKTKYSHIYKGTLYLAETVSVKSSDSNTYYVDEIFYKFCSLLC